MHTIPIPIGRTRYKPDRVSGLSRPPSMLRPISNNHAPARTLDPGNRARGVIESDPEPRRIAHAADRPADDTTSHSQCLPDRFLNFNDSPRNIQLTGDPLAPPPPTPSRPHPRISTLLGFVSTSAHSHSVSSASLQRDIFASSQKKKFVKNKIIITIMEVFMKMCSECSKT